MSRGLAGWFSGRRVRRLTEGGQRKVGEALDAVGSAEETAAVMRDTVGRRSPRHPPVTSGRNRRMRFAGVGLTVVNASVVVVMLILPDEGDGPAVPQEIGLAVLLGALLAAGQIAFAVAVGRRLQEARVAASTSPQRSIPFEGVALAMLGTLVGWVVYLWTRSRLGDDPSLLDDLLAVTLALQAWIAPWLLVAETAATQLSETSRLDALDRRIRELTASWELDRSTAALALISARSALHKAERIVARAAELSGQPIRASSALALRQLGTATTEAEARYAALIAGPDDDSPSGPPSGPLGQGDVDLAG